MNLAEQLATAGPGTKLWRIAAAGNALGANWNS